MPLTLLADAWVHFGEKIREDLVKDMQKNL